MVHFYAANDCSLFHIWIHVLEAKVYALLHVLENAIKFKTAKSTECKASNL